MSYHDDAVTNDLILTIINDGNGSECGMTYEQRKAAADTGIAAFRAACKTYSDRRATRYESPRANRAQILEAATYLQNYYREHAKESAQTCGQFVALVNGGDYRGTYCCTCGEKEAAHKVAV